MPILPPARVIVTYYPERVGGKGGWGGAILRYKMRADRRSVSKVSHCGTSFSRMRVMNHNWSAMKQSLQCL